MTALSRRLLVAMVATGAIVWIALLLAPRQAASNASVAVTSYPLLDIVRSVAGPSIEVGLVMPAGANPHSFEPTPSTIAMLAGANAVYAIGHGFDDWIDPVLRETGTKKIVVDDGIALRSPVEHISDPLDATGDDHDDLDVDPHYWLDAKNAAAIAAAVAADLSGRFPEKKEEFAANLVAAQARFVDTDRMVRETLSTLTNRKVVTLHDAWYYFAEAYGIEIVGSFEPTAAREPSPQYLAALEDAIRASGARTLYTEPGVATAAIQAFAADNGLAIVELDPIEGATDGNYHDILLHNAKTIRDHQR